MSDADVTITGYPDGPLVVRGSFEVRELDGTVTVTGPVAALCRCGRSGRKPLCDGTHRKPRPRRRDVSEVGQSARSTNRGAGAGRGETADRSGADGADR